MTSVSFVIPVYNKSKFLKPVIKSIKSQKGKFKKEYIFIDDGSTDDSYRILKQETKGMKDCQIIKQENKGSANATNQGIKTAKMKYIKFLDADDLILSDSTKLLVDILEKNSSCILAYGLQRKVDNIVNVNLNERINNYEIEMIENPTRLAMRNSMFNPSQFLVRTSICKSVGGCDERIRFSQEYSLTLRLSKIGPFVKLNYPIAILPFSAPGQISEKKNNQIFFSNCTKIMARYFGEIDTDKIIIGDEEIGNNGGKYRKISYDGQQMKDIQLGASVNDLLRCPFGIEPVSQNAPDKFCFKVEANDNLTKY